MMLKSEVMGVGEGSGGPLETGHVICPACAHNFGAIPQNAQDRIAELEKALKDAIFALEATELCLRTWNDAGSPINVDYVISQAREALGKDN